MMDKLCGDYTLVDGRGALSLYTFRWLYGRYRCRDDLDVSTYSRPSRLEEAQTWFAQSPRSIGGRDPVISDVGGFNCIQLSIQLPPPVPVPNLSRQTDQEPTLTPSRWPRMPIPLKRIVRIEIPAGRSVRTS